MTRTITDHKVNPANDTLTITVLDEPGQGGAHHAYLIGGFDAASNPSSAAFTAIDPVQTDERHGLCVLFQNGPIGEVGVNGITNEALLAIVLDRLRGFQSGQFACRENALAITKIEEARHWLHHRTQQRMARGVEGTHEK